MWVYRFCFRWILKRYAARLAAATAAATAENQPDLVMSPASKWRAEHLKGGKNHVWTVGDEHSGHRFIISFALPRRATDHLISLFTLFTVFSVHSSELNRST